MLLFPQGNAFVPGAWLDGVPVGDSWVLPGLVLGGVFGVGGVVELALIPQRSLIEVLYAALAIGLVVLPLGRRAREHLQAAPSASRGRHTG